MSRSASPKRYAWEDDLSGSPSRDRYSSRRPARGRRRNGRRSCSVDRRGRSPRYSPPPRRNRDRRSDSRSRRRSRSRSRSKGKGKGKGKSAVCRDFINGKCRRGDRCSFVHDEEECRIFADMLASTPCKFGANCTNRSCLFAHPGNEPRRRARSGSGSRSASPRDWRKPEVKVPMMKAVGWKSYGGTPVLEELQLPRPVLDARGEDILVRLHGTDVNPLNLNKSKDTLSTESSLVLPGHHGDDIMACSCAGIIEGLSARAEISGKFKVGDAVWFANSWEPTSDSIQEYTLVDHRLAALKPKTLSYADAAGIPLVALTAWGAMVERMNMDIHLFGAGIRLPRFSPDKKGVFLVLPGSCATGSFALQLAARYLNKNNNLTVVAAASRPESVEWCKKMGAEHVINHELYNLKDELDKIGVKGLDYLFYDMPSPLHDEKLYAAMNPFGQIASYRKGSFEKMDVCSPNRITIHREFIGLNNCFEGDSEVLATVTQLFDDATVNFKSVVTQTFSELTGEAVRKAQMWHTVRSVDVDAMGKAVFEIT